MNFKRIKWMLLTAVLTLCCACGTIVQPGAARSDAPLCVSGEAPAEPSLYCGETQLHWQVPACEYYIIETAAGEAGFAVLYEEQRPWYDEDTKQYRFLMAQIFNAQGGHELTAYTGVYDQLKKGNVTPNGMRMTRDKLYLDMGGDSYRGIDRAIGVVSQWQYEEIVRQDGTVLSYSGEYSDQAGSSGMRYRLKTADGTVFEMTVPGFDDNFKMALDFLAHPEYTDREGITYVATASIDAAAKTATISNTKLTYALDFNTRSYTCARRYTDEMLEDILATSPSGAVLLYDADSGGAGDAFWRDIVLKGRGGTTFLDFCSVLYGADFFDNDTVVLNEAVSLKAFDITGTEPVGRPILDVGSVIDDHGYTHPERLVIGMVVDRENQLLLAAVRDYTQEWDTPLPVTLAVFDADLQQTAAIETDCRIPPFRHNWPVQCEIALNGDGTADLFWRDEEPVRVRYMTEPGEALHTR